MSQLSKSDYIAMASFRRVLRRFMHFSETSSREAGLTPQQHQVLLIIRGMPDRDWAAVGELAEALQISHHAAVGLVDRCQAAGLTIRGHETKDRRVVRVSLTESGSDLLDQITARNLAELRASKTLGQILQGIEAQERADALK
jgi:DNA-binding MarR family transcriptional regulator